MFRAEHARDSQRRLVREQLAEIGLESFPKTSGGKGLHVLVPIRPEADWETAKGFAQAVAQRMAAQSPDRFVGKMTRSLRAGKIYIDYLRNGRGSTCVAAFSSRARENAGTDQRHDRRDPKSRSNDQQQNRGCVRENEFLKHAQRNFAAAGRPWTAEVERAVRTVLPNRWQDITAVLEAAEPPRNR